jgi:hypothetical protein
VWSRSLAAVGRRCQSLNAFKDETVVFHLDDVHRKSKNERDIPDILGVSQPFCAKNRLENVKRSLEHFTARRA